jgi:hypothetical protein
MRSLHHHKTTMSQLHHGTMTRSDCIQLWMQPALFTRNLRTLILRPFGTNILWWEEFDLVSEFFHLLALIGTDGLRLDRFWHFEHLEHAWRFGVLFAIPIAGVGSPLFPSPIHKSHRFLDFIDGNPTTRLYTMHDSHISVTCNVPFPQNV